MKDSAPQPVYLQDYTPPAWTARHVALTFRLHPTATRVLARIAFVPGAGAVAGESADLRLDGEKLTLISAAIDGERLAPGAYVLEADGLSVPGKHLPAGGFTWQAEVEINPQANTALEGLYMSKGMYCTQCEAEGFRKITYYQDRPDVMATFDVRVEGDAPVLLSNGNPGAAGEGFAEWQDPWPKPAYLFALVAGDLVAHRDSFATASGRKVDLAVWVRPGDEDRCGYAMDSLKRSMRWDERVYGREYDLDVFNIVAVDDFNMGAMENKGLNVFNSKYVLASPETATDRDYELIEGIVAHEYFHNWTGNRVTCRDWFQLSLKEGLTVFRDQQFSGDQRSHPVKRIEDVLQLRARQFREDAGPLAHPVRPASFVEINNFYTATVYEKGAELIGMLRRLVGAESYERALDLYFERHDGQAATIEDWLAVFQDATGRDLGQFSRWYTQAGTPRLSVTDDWADGVYTLTLEQRTPATPGQPKKEPLHIPVAVGLLGANGGEVVPTTVLELSEARQSFRFEGLASRPVPSILRGFSAPVIVERASSAEERAFLLAHDTDPFNKWEAGRSLARDVLSSMIADGAAPGPDYLDALERVARDEALDPAFRALALQVPSDDDMAQALYDAGTVPDPLAIRTAREKLRLALAKRLDGQLRVLYDAMNIPGPYTPDPKAAGCRALRATALGLITRLDDGATAARQFRAADNMTESLSALACLLDTGNGGAELAEFYRRWSHDRLVIDKWFALQIARAAPLDTVDTVRRLTGHPDFEWKNPNRFRAVFGALSANAAGFHAPGGGAYDLLGDWLIRLDRLNPQTAARMTTAFDTWRRYDPDRQAAMRATLQRIAGTPDLSRDCAEMVGRILGD